MAIELGALREALEDAGASREKARAAAEELASYNRDITDVRADFAALRSDLRADMTALRTDLKAEIADVRTDLKAEIADVRTDLKAEIADVRSDTKLLKWAVGVQVPMLVAILLRLFVHT